MKNFDSIKQELTEGRTTCEKITSDYLQRIQKEKRLNAFLSVYSENALESARLIDKKITNRQAGPLAGMVMAVKDNISMKGEQLSCASKILKNFRSLYDATVIEKLKHADAIIIGKTNMDEFAMGSSNENSAFGFVLNPIDETRVPGGSSGGSAVSVAANLSFASLGSDTGGSIRQPAALTGIVGLKPTYGRVSRYGLVAFASSFDQIGPLTNTTKDAAYILNIIAGYDERDSTSAKIPVPDYVKSLNLDVTKLKIGLPKEYFTEKLNPEIAEKILKKVDLLKENGAIVKDISLPHSEFTVAAYYILTTAEASSNLARYDGARFGTRITKPKDLFDMYSISRSEGFGSEVKRRIMLGTYVLSAGYYEAYYRKAQKVRRLIKEDFDRAYKEVDCIITPTTPSTAFKIGEKIDDPLMMYLSDIYTVSANLAGIPGISIPCEKDSKGLPVGLQILGKQFDEETLLRVGNFLENINQ